MPLPSEVLEKMKADIEGADALIKDIEETIHDMRESGIDALKQEERLREAKEVRRQSKSLYDLQMKRVKSE